MNNSDLQRIILFDGVCNLCNSAIDFVISHDKNNYFKFASLQSDAAKRLLQTDEHSTNSLKSTVLIEGKKIYSKSTAVLRIARHLERPFRYAYILILIPPFIRDAAYILIASYRYKWFGKRNQCRMPDNKTSHKFLS